MKKFKFLTILSALFLLLPAFTSCDKDNNETDEPEQPSTDIEISDILGTYSGSLGWKVATFEENFTEVYEVSISKVDDSDKVTVVLPECTYTPPSPNAKPSTIPSVTINDVNVEIKDNVCTLSKESFTYNDYETPSSLNGTIEGNKAVIYYNVTPGKMGMPINFTFTGTLK